MLLQLRDVFLVLRPVKRASSLQLFVLALQLVRSILEPDLFFVLRFRHKKNL